jgi:hypothetical protein
MQDHGFGLRRIQLSTKFVNKAKGRAGAMRWMLRATLKSKVLLYVRSRLRISCASFSNAGKASAMSHSSVILPPDMRWM